MYFLLSLDVLRVEKKKSKMFFNEGRVTFSERNLFSLRAEGEDRVFRLCFRLRL